jgi:8-oxo-dGTP pyrophosphatase MutT (NUDIX family)
MEEHFTGKVAIRVLIHKDGKVLLTRHPMDNTFGFPGGRLNSDEEPKACVLREVQEELGIAVKLGAILDAGIDTYDNGTKHFFVVYDAEFADPAAIMTPDKKEVGEVKWIGASEIADQKIYPSCKRAIAAYFN